MSDKSGFVINAEDQQYGQFLRAISASKTNGLFLVVDVKPATASSGHLAWIIAGLSNDSKLLATNDNAQELAVVRQYLDTDLRVAFHLQNTHSFVQDISHHRFNLIYVNQAVDTETANTLQTMLMQGGVLICNPATNKDLVCVCQEVASFIPLPAPLEKNGLKLYVKGERPLRRRGGRKAKNSRPSLRTA
ncbi:MAG: hypothetical protein ACPGVN_00445 [Alphaproteobacteria bacterium]